MVVDDNNNNNATSSTTTAQHHLFYHQLGAPVLLYRNHASYTMQDERIRDETTPSVRDFQSKQSALMRSAARWYYPMDHHHHHNPDEDDSKKTVTTLCEEWRPTPSHSDTTTQTTQPSHRASTRRPDVNHNNGDTTSVSSANNEQLLSSSEKVDKQEMQHAKNYHATLEDLEQEYLQGAEANDTNTSSIEQHQAQRLLDSDNNDGASGSSDHPQPSWYLKCVAELQDIVHSVTAVPETNDNDDDTSLGREDGTDSVSHSSEYDEVAVDGSDVESDEDTSHSTIDLTESNTNINTIKSTTTRVKEQNAAVKRAFRNEVYCAQQCFDLQLQARSRMLFSNADPSDVNVQCHAWQKLQGYTQLDTNYVPAGSRVKGDSKQRKNSLVQNLPWMVREQTEMYDRERTNRAHPAYLAPFHGPTLQHTRDADIASRITKTRPKYSPSFLRDDPNAPTRFGNCLLSFPCACPACLSCDAGTDETPTICLFHPVGPLQDILRLSFVALPRGRCSPQYEEPLQGIPEQLDLGDRLHQLVQCGQNPPCFFARTRLHCTVFTMSYVKRSPVKKLEETECWGSATLTRLHRIDCRTLWRGLPSYLPTDATCHPRYGKGFVSPCKVAVAYESTEGNGVHLKHMQIGKTSLSTQDHTVTNLSDVANVEFSSSNPMVLWASAKGFVRPALMPGYHFKRPRMGNGSSLYSIDLRASHSATFQWSPSAEEFVPECVFSLSGVHTDWSKDHCVWVSSSSAGKTWELDSRMPCQAVNSWSLAHISDEPVSVFPSTGVYGAGMLFSSPYTLGGGDAITENNPMLSVNKTPGAFGIHMYQRPLYGSRFQTQSMECATPGIAMLGSNISIAGSSVYALPDVGNDVFTCGLTSFRFKVSSYLGTASVRTLGYSKDDVSGIIYTISLTSNGDLYGHALLNTKGSNNKKKSDGLPLGCGMHAMPEISDTARKTRGTSWNGIRAFPQNKFPVPSHALKANVPKVTGMRDTIDLSIALQKHKQNKAKEKKLKRVQARKEKYLRKFAPKPSAKTEVSLATMAKNARMRTEKPSTLLVPRQPVRPVVVSIPGRAPEQLTLPRNLARTAPVDSIDYFDKSQQSVVENVELAGSNWKSDLTAAVLEDAWTEDVNETSSDESL